MEGQDIVLRSSVLSTRVHRPQKRDGQRGACAERVHIDHFAASPSRVAVGERVVAHAVAARAGARHSEGKRDA